MISKDGSKCFNNIRLVVHGILAARVKVSAEGVMESIVSRYGNHFESSRQPDDENALQEMKISEPPFPLPVAPPVTPCRGDKYW